MYGGAFARSYSVSIHPLDLRGEPPPSELKGGYGLSQGRSGWDGPVSPPESLDPREFTGTLLPANSQENPEGPQGFL